MNTPPPSDRAETFFFAALNYAVEDRRTYLEAACGEDVALLSEVLALVAAHEAAPSGFLGPEAMLGPLEPAMPGILPHSGRPRFSQQPGDFIGRYKLLQQIGEGGFGTVWMAEQVQPVIRRVALKIIKPGMDTREVIARFEAERQALAMMDYLNIAKVLDAGATETGRPFFVMELVKGLPITQYCDEAQFGTRERLALFSDVCSAINHAHQKGVIHRDIKPSNVMVTLHGDKPVVKVIDFGIAKATQGKLTEKTLFTRFEQFMGTPVYMSPEQVAHSGLDVDTRSDIYALGILLYELLTGNPPFDPGTLTAAGYEEMRRIIREVEPPKPSARLRMMRGEERIALAKARRAVPDSLGKLLEPDLDWIVMKAIDKDRERRYETANDLVLDIRRYLANEPVSATPPSAGYRFRKFALRHRAEIRVASAIVLLLFCATIVSSWLAVQASRARASAENQRQVTQVEALRAAEAEKRETQQRIRAQEQEAIARRRAYAADMLLCRQTLKSNDLREARQLLDRQRPSEGEEDLRGWEWRWLWGGCRSDALIQPGKWERRILQALYVGGGKAIVTYEDSGAVRRLHLDSGRSETLFEPVGGSPFSMASNSGLLCASQDRRWIAALGKEDKGYLVRIWDMLTNTPPREVPVGAERVTAIALSPDGSTLVTYVPDQNAAFVRDTLNPSGESLRTIQLRAAPNLLRIYGAVCFSPDGGTLAVGGFGAQVRLMNVSVKIADWTDRGDFTVDPNGQRAISALDFSADGRLLACGCMFIDPRIWIVDVGTGSNMLVLSGHRGFVTGLSFSPDGNSLASASADQTVKIWDVATWEERGTLLGHTDEVWSVDFSPGGERVISGGKDRRAQIWSAENFLRRDGLPVAEVPARFAESIDVAPGGKKYAYINSGAVTIAGERSQVAPAELGANNFKAFWSAPHQVIALSATPLEIKTWNTDMNEVKNFPLEIEVTGRIASQYLVRSNTLVLAVPHGTNDDVTVIRWDAETCRIISSQTFPIGDLHARQPVKFSLDGRRMAVSDWDSVCIYDIVKGTVISTIDVPCESGIQGMSLSPDGFQLAVAVRDSPAIMVRDVETGCLLTTLQGHNLVISSLGYSPDGTRLLSNTIGSEPVKVWNTQSWKEVARLEPPPGVFFSGPQFTSDGTSIFVIDYNFDLGRNGARLFHAPSWDEIEAAETRIKSGTATK